MKKNITAIFLVIAIMFGNMFLFPVSAAEEVVSIKIGSKVVAFNAATATVIEIPVSIEGNSGNGISAFELNFTYDVETLTYKDWTLGEVGEEFGNIQEETGIVDVGVKDGVGTIKAIGASIEGSATGNGTLFTLKFEVNQGATETANITLNYKDEIYNTVERDNDANKITEISKFTPGTVQILQEGESGAAKVGSLTGVNAVQVNETIKVPVSILMANDLKIAGYSLEIDYDPDYLLFDEKATKDSIKYFDPKLSGIGIATSTSLITLTIMGGYAEEDIGAVDISISGEVLELVFKVIDGSDGEDSTITDIGLIDAKAIRANDPTLILATESGQVEIKGVAEEPDPGEYIISITPQGETVGYTISNDNFLIVPFSKGGTSIADMIEYLTVSGGKSVEDLSIFNKDNVEIFGASYETELVHTGMTIKLDDKFLNIKGIVIYGDVDGDGVLTIDDAIKIMIKLVEYTIFSDMEMKSAYFVGGEDIEGNEALFIDDAIEIMIKLVEPDTYDLRPISEKQSQ